MLGAEHRLLPPAAVRTTRREIKILQGNRSRIDVVEDRLNGFPSTLPIFLHSLRLLLECGRLLRLIDRPPMNTP